MSADAREGFEAFYRREAGSVYRSLSVTLGNADLGREATDEAMARAFQHWWKISKYDNPAGWAYRVGLNWARSRFRTRRREVVDPAPREATDGGSVFDVQVDPALRGALMELPLTSRSVVVLRYLLDWSTADVADALGIAEGTVKSRLARALERLSALLEETP